MSELTLTCRSQQLHLRCSKCGATLWYTQEDRQWSMIRMPNGSTIFDPICVKCLPESEEAGT